MILSAHQPAYLPWLGYFDKIAQSDIFVYLDTVQFEKNSFINRNKIKTPQGCLWLTIPVRIKGHTNATISTLEIDECQAWRIKHLKTIEMNYRKSPYFHECFPKYEALLNMPISNLAELCWQQMIFWLAEFEIATKLVRLSDLNIFSKKSELIQDICKNLSADKYLSGIMGKNYLNESNFSADGINIIYQNFNHPIYLQNWGLFEPNMGIIDYWMNYGSGKITITKESNNGF